MGRMEMNCSKALKLISLVIDGEATERQARLLEFHLMGCRSCRRAMSISRDISKITRNLPTPVLPDDLEKNVGKMLRNGTDTESPVRRFPKTFLAIPAAAAVFILVIAILPVSHSPQSIPEPGNAAVSVYELKNTGMKHLSKSGIRIAPLSEYSRQTSMISF